MPIYGICSHCSIVKTRHHATIPSVKPFCFFKMRKLDVEKIVPWLQSHGGYCDCEVMYNVQDKFQNIVEDD